MKFNKWTVGLILFGLLLWSAAARAQGTVTFNSINSQSELDTYLNQSSSIGYIDTEGFAGFYPSTLASYDASSANNTSVSLAVGGNSAQFSVNIVSGQFGSTGGTASESVSSLTPIIGLAIGIISPYQSQGRTATISDLYIGANYEGLVADTSSSTFSGMLCSFQNQSSTFNMTFTLATPLSSASEIKVGLISAVPVPEPNTLVLVGLGAVSLLAFRRPCRRK